MKKIAIYGAGGFGREVLTLINDINRINHQYQVIGFFDDGKSKEDVVNGYNILGGYDEFNAWPEKIDVVLAIASPEVKRRIVENLNNDNIEFPTLIHPSAIIMDKNYSTIDCGCIVCAGVIISVNTILKRFVALDWNCTVGHDTEIKDYCSFMPSVNVSGESTIGEGVYVGVGAKLINRLTVGDNTIIGAGAVVAKDLPANCTAVGVPAKVIKFH